MKYDLKLILVALVVLNATPSLAQETKEQQLSAFFTSLTASTKSVDSASYERHFMPQAVMYLPNRPPLIGRAAIGAWFIDFRQNFLMVLDRYEQEQLDILGDVALVRSSSEGHYIVTATNEHVPFAHKFLDVLRYENGNWYMSHHVASSATFELGLWNRDWESKVE